MQEGQHPDLLAPPAASYVFRGVQVRRSALAGLLGGSGAVRGVVHLPDLRSIGSTDPARDRSWTLSDEVAVGFASARDDMAPDYFPDDEEQRVYGAVIVARMDYGAFVLNSEGAAADPEIGGHENPPYWPEGTLGPVIAREREVVTEKAVETLFLVYARWDRIAELAGLLSAELARGVRSDHVHGPGCSHRAHTPTSDDLPSDWQPAGRFKGYRTVDLTSLAYNVAEYAQRVDPLYVDATVAVVRAIERAYTPGSTSADEAEQAGRKANDALDRLAARWSADTLDLYRATVDSSVRQVRKWTGYEVDRASREGRADAYHDAAMGYLTAPDGLIGTLRSVVAVTLRQVTSPSARTLDGANDDLIEAIQKALAGEGPVAADAGTSSTARLAALTPTSTRDEVSGAVAQAFEAQAYRTDNWSGALVELSHETLTKTLSEQALAENADPNHDPDSGVVDWYYEWCDVGDGVTCRVCEQEGARGFQPAAAFTFNPGSQMTDCKKRCRCVMVAWLGSEVRNGTAVSLAGSSKTP
jgi:hypothetical protein